LDDLLVKEFISPGNKSWIVTIKLEILRVEGDQLECRLEDGIEIWFENKTDVDALELIGDVVETSVLAILNNASWEAKNRPVEEEMGVRHDIGFSNRLVNEVVGKVKEYNPENRIDSRWPLIEIETGIGTVFIEHHNVGLSPSKRQYPEGRKAQVIADKLQIHSIED